MRAATAHGQGMTAASELSLPDRYLDLVEAALCDQIHPGSRLERVVRGLTIRLRHPWLTRAGGFDWPARAHTMIGRARLANLRRLVEATLRDAIAGDYIETGVWRGGACILIRAVLAAHGATDRRVFVADSFEGLPRPDPEKHPADRGDKLFSFRELAISEDEVRRNFAAYGLLDAQVVFLKGFFRDTLPRLTDERFALIRLDGDMYESTCDALTNLYDRVSPGGYVIVDDYGSLGHCRKAVHDFLDARRLSPKIEPVDEGCVWWRKEAE
jgi:O-methyltransferase